MEFVNVSIHDILDGLSSNTHFCVCLFSLFRRNRKSLVFALHLSRLGPDARISKDAIRRFVCRLNSQQNKEGNHLLFLKFDNPSEFHDVWHTIYFVVTVSSVGLAKEITLCWFTLCAPLLYTHLCMFHDHVLHPHWKKSTAGILSKKETPRRLQFFCQTYCIELLCNEPAFHTKHVNGIVAALSEQAPNLSER